MATNDLFKEIKVRNENVASALEEAGLTTDEEIQSLTREDLRDLLPGLQNLTLRKQVFDIIQKQNPNTSNGVDCLSVLMDLKTQMTQMQDFLDARFRLLEESRKSQPPQDQDKGSSSSLSLASGSLKRHNSQTSNSPQIAEGRRGSSTSSVSSVIASIRGRPQRTQVMVTYKMVVSGKTFDAHLQLLEKVKASSGESDLILHNQEESQSNQDCRVVIVFCPVVSRIGTDGDIALKNASGPEPVILVFMHHIHAAKPVTSPRTWDTSSKVVLCVHVFYHETVPGLLQCQENNAAIAEIRRELLSRSVEIPANTRGNAENENRSSFLPNWNIFNRK